MSGEEDMTPRERAEDLIESIDTDVVDVDVDDLESRFKEYEEYDVHGESARQSIINTLSSEHNVDAEEMMTGGSGSQEVTVDEIDEPDQFVDLEVEVSDLWDNDHEKISQVGLIHDDTGKIKFTAWAKSGVPLLTEGETYRLENVATDEWQGDLEVNLNSQTEVEIIDDEFEEPDNTMTFSGTLVDLRAGSGLIRRCTANDDCTRVLNNGECSEHGDVDGEFDLRLKGVVDDGDDTVDVIIGRELTEKMTGIPIEEAKSMAQDALDTDVVGDEMADEVILNYYEFEGWETNDGRLVVQEVEDVDAYDTEDVEELLMRASSLQGGTAAETESETEEDIPEV